jgi:hypothetical protein
MNTSHHTAQRLSCDGPQHGQSRLTPVEGKKVLENLWKRPADYKPGPSPFTTRNTRARNDGISKENDRIYPISLLSSGGWYFDRSGLALNFETWRCIDGCKIASKKHLYINRSSIIDLVHF